ncbi:hypothetical protein ACLK19_25370 [Escherichia coli]
MMLSGLSLGRGDPLRQLRDGKSEADAAGAGLQAEKTGRFSLHWRG